MGIWDTILGKDPEQVELDEEAARLESGEELRETAQAGYEAAGRREAPQARAAQLGTAVTSEAATIDPTQQAQFRQRQMSLADMLGQQAAGRGPSVAGTQWQAATERNLAQQQALAAGARGGGVAGASRQAAQNISGFGQQAAQQAAIGRIQEQQAARAQLGTLLGQGRTADIGLATGQAGLTQQTSLANQAAANEFLLKQGAFTQETNLANIKAALVQTGMNDAQQLAYLQELTGMDATELAARMEQDRLRVEQRAAGTPGILGDLIAAAGTVGAKYSDINLKEDIKPGGDKIDDFLSKIEPYEYKYKEPEKFGEGRSISPMAQDLEESELGNDMVMDTPEGKMVDYGKGLGTIVAALAHLDSKIEELKKGKK